MTVIPFTEFRRRASELLTRVEKGEMFLIVRHGRPIAEITPVAHDDKRSPSWKKPTVRLVSKGARLTEAILEERAHKDLL